MTYELPARRNSPTISFELSDGYACQGYSAQYSEFAPGDLGEVFLTPIYDRQCKIGQPLDTMAKDLSVLFSIARRYGAPTDVIRAALSQQADGKMLGPLGEFLRLHDAERRDPEEPAPAPVASNPQPTAPAGAAEAVEVA